MRTYALVFLRHRYKVGNVDLWGKFIFKHVRKCLFPKYHLHPLTYIWGLQFFFIFLPILITTNILYYNDPTKNKEINFDVKFSIISGRDKSRITKSRIRFKCTSHKDPILGFKTGLKCSTYRWRRLFPCRIWSLMWYVISLTLPGVNSKHRIRSKSWALLGMAKKKKVKLSVTGDSNTSRWLTCHFSHYIWGTLI